MEIFNQMVQNSERFVALDIFRGMTICLMIIVNTPGSWSTTFPPLLHADWHGFTITDLVFPSFLFAVGNALAFVQNKWADKSQTQIFTKIFRRTLLLFFLGYTMYWIPFMRWTDAGTLEFFPIAETRIMGVLQRIALCYLLASFAVYYLKEKTILILSGAILLLYWIAMVVGGDLSMSGNLGHKIDMIIIGAQHLYQGEGVPFDPEGLFSTIPSTVNVLAGYLVGRLLIKNGVSFELVTKLMVIGVVSLLVAYFWHFEFPINKKLWTSSFVLWTIGLDLLVLAVIIYFVNLSKKPLSFKFFQIFGTNSLAIFLLSEYIAILMWFFRTPSGQPVYSWVYENAFQWIGNYLGSFLFALSVMLICWLVAKCLEKKEIYIKV